MAHYLSLIQSKVCDVGWLAPWVGWAAALGGSYPVPLLAHTLGTQQGLARLYVVDDGEDLVDVGHLLPHEGLQVLDLGVQPGVFLPEFPGLPPGGLHLLHLVRHLHMGSHSKQIIYSNLHFLYHGKPIKFPTSSTDSTHLLLFFSQL